MTPDDLSKFGDNLSAATVYEAIGKRGEVGPNIYPIIPGSRILGPARTVRCVLGDALAVWRALAIAKPGSVLVIDMGGSAEATAIGGTSALVAKQRGLAGIVTNASVRDVAEIRAIGLPVFAAGISVRGTMKSHEGYLSVPITIGAAVVHDDDLVIGDDDGIVIVPQSFVSALQARVETQRTREAEIDRRVRAGEDILRILGLTGN